MSACLLSTDDLQPVADLIERVQNVQTAVRDLHEAHAEGCDFAVAITRKSGVRDSLVASTHRLSYWVVMQGLAAMERELLKQLEQKEITVESVLPIREVA